MLRLREIPIRSPFLRTSILLVLSGLGWGGPAAAQSGNMIETEIDQAVEGSLWRLGPLRLTPQLRLGGGYDDNALSSAFVPISDVSFSVGPGLRAVTPLGRRGLIDVYQEVDFVYFRELEELRDIFGITRAGVAFGGKDLVVRVEDEFRSAKTRPSSEFDVPVDQKTNRLAASVGLALGWRHQLSLGYENMRTRVGDQEPGVGAGPASERLDRDQVVYRLRLSRYVTARTTFLLEAFREKFDFVQTLPQGQPDGYGMQGGFSFAPKGKLRGQALVGFKAITPDAPEVPEFKGLTGAVDVQSRLGKRFGVGALFSRNLQASVLEENWFFVETRYGGSLQFYLTRNFFVSPAVSVGRNTYPEPVRTLNEQGVLEEQMVVDRFGQYSLSVNYLVKAWKLTVGGTYLTRDSDLRVFEKDRFFINLGLAREF